MLEPHTLPDYGDDEPAETDEPTPFDRLAAMASMHLLLGLLLEPRTHNARGIRAEVVRWLFTEKTGQRETISELCRRLRITRRRFEQVVRECRSFAVAKD